MAKVELRDHSITNHNKSKRKNNVEYYKVC